MSPRALVFGGGDLTEGFLRYAFVELIFVGTYFRIFMVSLEVFLFGCF